MLSSVIKTTTSHIHILYYHAVSSKYSQPGTGGGFISKPVTFCLLLKSGKLVLYMKVRCNFQTFTGKIFTHIGFYHIGLLQNRRLQSLIYI